MALEIGDIVLCTVDRIVGTIVFVKIEGTKKEGSIILSEIAPGRIRNLRAYVVPKKKIVCKILRISKDYIDLSLRRVTQKEKKEVLEKIKQEKIYEGVMRNILKEKFKDILKKVREKQTFYEFLEEAKENPKDLEKLTGKENAKKILEIIKIQKKKKLVIKKEINLTTNEPNGLELIKEILGDLKGIEVRYVSAGKYSLKKETEDIKKTDNEIKEILKDLEKEAKNKNMVFVLKEK